MMGFLNASMTSATQRFMNYMEGQGDIEKKKEIFNTSLFIHIISLIVCLVLGVAGLVFFNGGTVYMRHTLFMDVWWSVRC